MQDNELVRKVHKIMNGEFRENFMITRNRVLVMKGKMCIPNVDDLREAIMEETHCSAYTMHSGNTKMYQTIKKNYWWSDMKRDIVEFVFRCLICQQMKAEHQKLAGTLQPLLIPEWKWEHITMDFVIGLSRT